jgi:hypothetical protein
MRKLIHGSFAVCSLLVSASAFALKPGDRVDDFRLLDHQGGSHSLYYLSDMQGIVLLVQQNDCKAMTQALPQLAKVRDQYHSRGVEVLMLNSNLQEDRDSIARAVGPNAAPVLLDSLQLVGESLDATQAGEVFLINPKNWSIAYRGSMDHLTPALDAVLAGQPVAKAATRTKSCKVRMPERNRERAHAKISYAKTIAPMLNDKCVKCHREGGIGPWQMSGYDMVKGFAPMIREVVRTERMPPWHADPHYGVFSNDHSLTPEDAKTLVHWIEAGAPRGKGSDPLTANQHAWPEWTLGKPDLIVEIPAFDVPATGTIPYQTPRVKNPLGRDVYVRAIEFAPTNRQVVHHILSGTARQGKPSSLIGVTSLGVFVPGDVPHPMPDDTGVLLPKDDDFIFQIHYTANGKAVAEVTHVAFYFTEVKPRYPLETTILLDSRLKIPANTKYYTATVSRTFDRDVLVYTMMPHSHFRGRAAQFTAHYPDGRDEVLLAVPRYDFNWQTTYELKEPKLLPKGTRLEYSSSYDNSSQNPANPDPNVEVKWGEQTWEEMIYGDVRYRYVEQPAVVTGGG